MRSIWTIGVFGLTLCGCSSITGSSNQSVSVVTRESVGREITGASCELSNNKGKWFVTTPGSTTIHRSNDDLQVICRKEGYDPGKVAVVSETKGSMFGNIIFGGGIGAVIDHNNGSAYEYPNFIDVMFGSFSKLEKAKANSEGEKAGVAPLNSTGTTQVASAGGGASKTTFDRLAELKELRERGLISEDVYLERQRKILENQ